MEAPPLERKLVAIFAADVAGYSRLMERDEAKALATLSSHRSTIDEGIVRHRGRIAGTAGDSVLAEFASVLDAVAAAVEIQNALLEGNNALPADQRMELRIGINVGDVMLKDGDIFGDGVNIAARLQSLAQPGGICVSRGVRDHIRHKMPVAFEDLGEQRVKNITRPIRVFRLRLGDGFEANQAADTSGPAEAPQADDVEIEFWDTIKHSSSALEYRVYLESYPEGAFASLAQARIRGLEGGDIGVTDIAKDIGSVRAKSVELLFWDSVKDSSDPQQYRAYLEKYPAGEFAALAEAKLAALHAAREEESHP
jgi:adenylate cyclase